MNICAVIIYSCSLFIFTTLSLIECEILLKPVEKLELIEHTGAILCNFRTKTIHVYFENRTFSGYSGEVLRHLSNCGTSYITLRNRFKTTALETINDDGILMYLLMILHDPAQQLDLLLLRKKSAAKHLSHVLLIVTESEVITAQWLRKIFRMFWQIWFLNVTIMYWRNRQLQVFRYNPFANESLIYVQYSGALPSKDELFPKKLPDMRRRALRMCMYHDQTRAIFTGDRLIGSDGFMSGYIAERLNALRVVHRVSSYGNFSQRADICFREVAQGIDDVALNIRFLSLPSFFQRVEYTTVHDRDDLCVLVPKAKIATTFWNLFRSFTTLVWVTILLSVALAYAFCAVMYRKLSQSDFVLLQIFASTLSMPLTHIPARMSLRLFLFWWLFYGMLICNAFKGNLTSNLMFRTYLDDINTVKDLALSPYDVLTFARHTKHLDYFLNTSEPYEAMIQRKITVVPDKDLYSNIHSNNLSHAYLQKYHVAIFRANARNHTRYGRPLFHVMSTCLVPFYAVYIVPFGSPYLGFFNSLIRSSQEFGFTVYWDRLMNSIFTKWVHRRVRDRQSEDDPVVLKLKHVQAVFGLLFLGLVLALLVFLWEIFKHKCCKFVHEQFLSIILNH